MEKIKYILRKNKIIAPLVKPIYRKCKNILYLPKQKSAYKETVSLLSTVSKSEKKIWYFGVPTHSNLGDQAQKYCITKWIEANYYGYRIIKISSDAFNYKKNALINLIQNKSKPDDLMIMQSGYTFDGLHPDENSHKLVSETFVNNRIVFFPQTILFKNIKLKDIQSKAINSHKRTLLLARDRISYESALQYYPEITVKLFPDIVTTLIGTQSYTNKRDGVLLCIRNDGEKLYSDAEIMNLARKIKNDLHISRVDITDTSHMDKRSIYNDTALLEDIKKNS